MSRPIYRKGQPYAALIKKLIVLANHPERDCSQDRYTLALVRSVRGAGGGYLLTRDPGDYTVGQILRPLEGDLAPVDCVGGGVCCERAEKCVTMEVWAKIEAAVSSVVDHITLADLVRRSHERGC